MAFNFAMLETPTAKMAVQIDTSPAGTMATAATKEMVRASIHFSPVLSNAIKNVIIAEVMMKMARTLEILSICSSTAVFLSST